MADLDNHGLRAESKFVSIDPAVVQPIINPDEVTGNAGHYDSGKE